MTCHNWLCTWNNPNGSAKDMLEWVYLDTHADYLVGQLERGTEGTPHLQFYVHYARCVRITHITKKFPSIHCEKVKRDNGASSYCMKEDTRVEGPFTFGTVPVRRNSKTDWEQVRTLAKQGKLDEIPAQIYTAHYGNLQRIKKDHMVMPPASTELKGVWIYGPSGIGKSFTARQSYPEAYPKLCNKWWDGYQGQENVIMDDIGPEHECLAQQLKIWADHYPCILETKGGAMPSAFTKFVVTSQYKIEEIFKDEKTQEALKRRFKVIRWAFPQVYPEPQEEQVLTQRQRPMYRLGMESVFRSNT